MYPFEQFLTLITSISRHSYQEMQPLTARPVMANTTSTGLPKMMTPERARSSKRLSITRTGCRTGAGRYGSGDRVCKPERQSHRRQIGSEKRTVVAHKSVTRRSVTRRVTARRNRGTPGRIRTCDLLVRNELLYPAELRGRVRGEFNRSDEPVELASD